MFWRKDSIPKIEKLINKVIDLSDKEKYAKALQVCESILELDPNYDRVYFERAIIYLNQDRDELAREDLEKLMTINPDYPGGKDWYSKTLAALNEHEKAANILLELLRSPKGDRLNMGPSPYSWVRCAEYYIEAGQEKQAIFVIEEYFSEYEQNVSVYRSDETAPLRIYSKLLLKAGNKEEALSIAEKAINSKHHVPADYLTYIDALIENKELESAKTQIDKFIQEIHHGHEIPEILELKKKLESNS